MGLKQMAMATMASAGIAAAAMAAPEVDDIVAKQRYPWNALVDVSCTVSGMGSNYGGKFALWAVMPDSGEERSLSHFWVVRDGMKSSDLAVGADGGYRLLWDARADLGQVACSNMAIKVEIVDYAAVSDEKVQLWENGPYWATKNIGAENPEDYGWYFWWGDTVGYRRENGAWVATDGSTSNFSFNDANTPTYAYGKSIDTLRNEGWITADGVLAPEHDAAHVHWGGDWRMPTDQELYDLCYDKCDWTWTTLNGVNGYVVRGRGAYADNSIFLPAAGSGYGTSLRDSGSYGYYWSSVPRPDYDFYSWFLYFNSGHRDADDFSGRGSGRSVRPVQGFAQ